jgi:peptide/nickel transport system permease protein
MLSYLMRRLLLMIPTLFAISVVTFIIIQLPPGDFLDSLVAGMNAQGEEVNQEAIQALRDRYGLGQPIYVQYFKWIGGVLQGDFGQSFLWNRPVKDLIWERIGLTVLLSLGSLLVIWMIALPVGIYSAVRRYSPGDYLASFLAFVGVAVPEFLIALVLMFVAFKFFGLSVGGLFSPDYVNAPWSLARLGDLLAHLWVPVLIIAIGSTGDLIRIMRANLLDELSKPYVVTARAKGLSETRLLLKYPVRLALNPFVSTIGYVLPGLVSGATIVSVVLSLPTTGPLQLEALQTQDMYLAGSIILMISVLTVIGTLISDLLLAWLDPRIRLQ